MIDYTWIFLFGFLGMVCHFIKKYQKDELEIRRKNVLHTMIKYFFKKDAINTVLTLISYIVVTGIIIEIGEHSLFTAFSAGYMSDSIFNKAEERLGKLNV